MRQLEQPIGFEMPVAWKKSQSCWPHTTMPITGHLFILKQKELNCEEAAQAFHTSMSLHTLFSRTWNAIPQTCHSSLLENSYSSVNTSNRNSCSILCNIIARYSYLWGNIHHNCVVKYVFTCMYLLPQLNAGSLKGKVSCSFLYPQCWAQYLGPSRCSDNACEWIDA